MQPFDIETIRPLVADQTIRGQQLETVFLCPVSGQTVAAQSRLEGGAQGGSEMLRQMRRSAALSLRGPLAGAVRSLFGRGSTLARLAGDVASSATYSATQPLASNAAGGSTAEPDPEARLAAATIEAFRSVASSFRWDAERTSWIACS